MSKTPTTRGFSHFTLEPVFLFLPLILHQHSPTSPGKVPSRAAGCSRKGTDLLLAARAVAEARLAEGAVKADADASSTARARKKRNICEVKDTAADITKGNLAGRPH